MESGAAAIVMLNAFCADCAGLLESVTCTVKLETALGPSGVPEITPVFAVRLKPAGKVPLKRLHVKGNRPPVTANVWL